MKHTNFYCPFLLLMMMLTTYASPLFAKGEAKQKPNIIIIYTDDQGYGDISALNSNAKFKTPNLDRLVNEGVAFTNGHSPSSVCTPSRYGLLTGRYPWRTTLKRGVMGAEGDCLIPDERITIASLLQSKGYNTGMVGKWHLGMQFPGEKGDRDWSQPITDMPLDKGFDYFYGIPASLNFGMLAWINNRHVAVPPTQRTSKKKNKRTNDFRIMPPYISDTVQNTKKKRGIMVAPDFRDDQCLTRFTDKAIEWLGEQKAEVEDGNPFFLYLPYTSPHYPVCPLPEFNGQGECGAYGEFLIETDYHIGQILEFLEKSGLDDNTLVIFTSDNGPERSWKARIPEYGHDSRGGFRGGKRSVYEGGHRVPFIVRWPAGIESPGRQWDKTVGQVDLLATIAEITEYTLPDNVGEDSQSFAPVLTDASCNYNRLPLINQGNGKGEYGYSITSDNWKLVMPNDLKPAELYNLSEDMAETKNLALQYPKKVKKLTKEINKIIFRGRTTKGVKQLNDTEYWDDLTWITELEYSNNR